MRAKIGRYAATTTTAAVVKRCQLTYPTLSKQTVHEFKKVYLKQKEVTNKDVTVFKSRKRGRPKLLPEDIMTKTIQTVKGLRLKGAPVSSAVINAIARGVVMAEDRCLHTEYGGYLAFSDQWARNILNEIMRTEKKMVRRIATTSNVPVALGLLKEKKLHFKERSKNLLLSIKFRKNLLLTLIRYRYPILL